MRLASIVGLLVACDGGGEGDTGDTGGTTDDSKDTDSASDTNDTYHTGETGETGEPTVEEPVFSQEDGATGLRIELTYPGEVGAEDTVHIGIWNSGPARSGSYADRIVVSASFPKTVEKPLNYAEIGGTVYLAAYLDRGNNNYRYPGSDDLVLIYGPGDGTSWEIPLAEGKVTTGITLAFEDPY
jgi:hypothetical protein